MGRELQKKKNRSSIPRARRKPKSKKKILSNPIIAANWNQKETLSQNYRRLGLVSRLNKSTGGVEKTPSAHTPSKGDDHFTQTFSSSAKSTGLTDLAEVRVERDPKTGGIISVLGDRQATRVSNPLNDPLEDSEDGNSGTEFSEFAHVPSPSDPKTAVVEQLQTYAQNGLRKPPRKQSTREEEWIASLVAKHGDNFEGMFRDTKLNPMQQSMGDIKRRVNKWSANQQDQSQ